MDLAMLISSSLFSSVVGGTVVVVVSHHLTRRHDLRMKRELYREVLYREKVAAYKKVYALATSYIHDFEHLRESSPDRLREAYERAVAVKKEMENSGLFMPDDVLAAVGALDETSHHIVEHPSVHKARFELEADLPEEVLVFLTFADQLKSVVQALREDLGVETLTADLNEFFRAARMMPPQNGRPYGLQKPRRADASDGESGQYRQ